VNRTVLVTFNQKLFRAQTKTLSREIHKRERKLEKLQHRLRRRRPDDRGKKPTVAGVKKKVGEILHGRHMADLFRTQIHPAGQGLPRLRFQFRAEALNATNHANFANPSSDINSSTFGFITGTIGPNQSRQWRFGARVSF